MVILQPRFLANHSEYSMPAPTLTITFEDGFDSHQDEFSRTSADPNGDANFDYSAIGIEHYTREGWEAWFDLFPDVLFAQSANIEILISFVDDGGLSDVASISFSNTEISAEPIVRVPVVHHELVTGVDVDPSDYDATIYVGSLLGTRFGGISGVMSHEFGHALGFTQSDGGAFGNLITEGFFLGGSAVDVHGGPVPIEQGGGGHLTTQVLSIMGGNSFTITDLDVAVLNDIGLFSNGRTTSGDDQLRGTDFADEIRSLAGNDTVFGNDGNDIIIGGLGVDELNGGLGDDVIIAGTVHSELGTEDTAVLLGLESAWEITGGTEYAVLLGSDGERDKLFGIEFVQFDDSLVELEDGSALDGQGNPEDFITAERVALLYEAALNRDGNIDLPGLNFYISVTERDELTDEFLAQDLMTSSEFTENFGDANNLSNADFLEQIYLNVLDRASDAAGRQFYLDLLDAGTITKALALADIAISPENTSESFDILKNLYESSEGQWAFL